MPHKLNFMYLECVRLEPRKNNATNEEFFSAIFRPVKDFLPSGKTIYSGTGSASRPFNPSKAPQVGDAFEGVIKQFDTTDYQIDGLVVNKSTIVAFSDENPIDVANKLLERNNACVVVNGKPTKVLSVVKPEEATA